jgi:hypothetical protein
VDGFFTIPGWKFHDRNSLETATRMDETDIIMGDPAECPTKCPTVWECPISKGSSHLPPVFSHSWLQTDSQWMMLIPPKNMSQSHLCGMVVHPTVGIQAHWPKKTMKMGWLTIFKK